MVEAKKQRKKDVNQNLNTKQRKKNIHQERMKQRVIRSEKDMKPKQKQKKNKKYEHNNLELLEEVEKV